MFRLRKVHSLKNANIWKREVNHIVSMKKKSENDFRFLKNSAVGVGTAIGLSVYFSEGNSIFGYTVDTSKVTSKSKQWNGVHLVLLANGVVFGMWQLANLNTNWVRFMADHFTSSYQHTIQGRYHTLLTSAFSHRGFLHFGINMFMLAQFGNALVDVTDARMRARRYFGAMSSPKVLSDMQFYALYGASAFASSISSNLLLASRGMPASTYCSSVVCFIVLSSPIAGCKWCRECYFDHILLALSQTRGSTSAVSMLIFTFVDCIIWTHSYDRATEFDFGYLYKCRRCLFSSTFWCGLCRSSWRPSDWCNRGSNDVNCYYVFRICKPMIPYLFGFFAAFLFHNNRMHKIIYIFMTRICLC